jgi:hypothetical protein
MPKKNIRKKSLLVTFLFFIQLKLSKPQWNNIYDIINGIISCESKRTISAISKASINQRNKFTMIDFIKNDTVDYEQIEKDKIEQLMILIDNEAKKSKKPVILSIDDVKLVKPLETNNIEFLDYYKDYPKENEYSNQVQLVTLKVACNNISFSLAFKIYLRKKTVSRINYHRRKENKPLLSFKTKYSLAKELLKLVLPHFKKRFKTYVCFDNWYSSANFIKFCLKNNLNVICGIKSNRNFNGKNISELAKKLRFSRTEKPQSVKIRSKYRTRSYKTYTLTGRINKIRHSVKVVISDYYRKGKRSTRFFISTDVTLTSNNILNIFNNRWGIEVDYFYLKCFLGLGDFRLRSYEGFRNFVHLEFLAYNYLQYRHYYNRGMIISDEIYNHKVEQRKEYINIIYDLFEKGFSKEFVFEKCLSVP